MNTLTLGPLLFHWDAARRRDFYLRVADEAPVERVYLGEVVCSKREPLFEPHLEQVVQRLRAAGKEVVCSTLALPASERELTSMRRAAERGELVEANDVSAVHLLEGRPFVVGPYVNVLNEAALDVYARLGARRVVLAPELSGEAIATLTRHLPSMEFEVQVFGRQPLALAVRCASARLHHAHKDSCQLVCGEAPDGQPVATVDGAPLYSLNGTQTLSQGSLALVDRLGELDARGVHAFRLSPQDVDMVAVARIHRQVLDGRLTGTDALGQLRALVSAPFINGSYLGREGLAWVAQRP